MNVWTPLYIFADRFDVPGLRELIISRVWQHFVPDAYCMTYVDIALAFRSLPISSPLCRLYMDICSTTWDAASDQKCPIEQKLRAKVPPSFFFVLAAKLQEELKGARVETIEAICTYHEHALDDDAKALCKKRLKALPADPVAKHQDWDEMEEIRAQRYKEADDVDGAV